MEPTINLHNTVIVLICTHKCHHECHSFFILEVVVHAKQQIQMITIAAAEKKRNTKSSSNTDKDTINHNLDYFHQYLETIRVVESKV